MDDVKSITLGLEDILYWQQRANWQWSKGVAMYNSGNDYRGGATYANDVRELVKELKSCGI